MVMVQHSLVAGPDADMLRSAPARGRSISPDVLTRLTGPVATGVSNRAGFGSAVPARRKVFNVGVLPDGPGQGRSVQGVRQSQPGTARPGRLGSFWCVKGRGRAQGASLARRQRLPTTCLRWCHLYTTAEDVVGLISTRHGRMYLERECPAGPANIGGHRQARGARRRDCRASRPTQCRPSGTVGSQRGYVSSTPGSLRTLWVPEDIDL
jgi:hypothetical protein